jgi:GTP-binding protein Era
MMMVLLMMNGGGRFKAFLTSNLLNSSIMHRTLSSSTKKRLDVAIVGAPNAGKSQLLNVLTDAPVAAVSRKRHTTRDGILGARTLKNTQLIFMDTPGFLQHTKASQENLRELMASTSEELQCVDYTLLVVDAARTLTDELKETLVSLMLLAMRSEGRQEVSVVDYTKEGSSRATNGEIVESASTPPERSDNPLSLARQDKFAVVLNKVDLVHPKTKLLDLAEEIANLAEGTIRYRGEPGDPDQLPPMTDEELDELYPPFFYASALKKDDEGVKDVLEHLLEKATVCDSWLVPPDASSLQSPTQRVEEVIREKIYRCLHREVPHHVQQINRVFRKVEKEGQELLIIEQDLVVHTKSHQKLVRGSSGKTLQRIQETAQRDLERVFGSRVLLTCHVKLRKSKHKRELESETSDRFSSSQHPFRVD